MGDGKAGFGTGKNFRPGTPVKKIGGVSVKEFEKKVEQWAQKAETREKLLDILVPYIRTRGIQFLDGWLIQVVSAKSDAEAPPDEESKSYWFIALLGNLVWAASCFVPGAGVVKAAAGGMSALGKTFYATMAVGGAAVGSGTIQQLTQDSSGTPTGKDIVATYMNGQRKKLEEVFKKNIDSFAREIVRKQGMGHEDYERDRTKYLEQVDRLLWEAIFPEIPYGDLDAIYQTALKSIKTALVHFKTQYKTWSEGREYYGRSPHREPGGHIVNYGGDEYRKRVEEFERRHPFRPNLFSKEEGK